MSGSLSKERLLQVKKEDLVTMYLNLNSIFEGCSCRQKFPLDSNITTPDDPRDEVNESSCKMEDMEKQSNVTSINKTTNKESNFLGAKKKRSYDGPRT